MNFPILNLFEFTSERKRMSIIIKDNDTIKLYIKGADSEIQNRLSKESNSVFSKISKYYVDEFSKVGYRTLLLGMKILDEKEYKEFEEKFKEASTDLKNKKQRIDNLMDEMEKEIYLIGATIVEDKLQDKVPETIKDLRLAGIKIWMLTGDKMNTAYNIGLSCNLISTDVKCFFISGEKNEDISKLEKEYQLFSENNPTQNFSVVIDSIALSKVLGSKKGKTSFLKISYNAVAVICCRVSPLQKSDVVKMMKEYDEGAVTLSVGDGGNDVSMIMEAHIGIGVYGNEGMRAVQAGDFAIGEFRILRKLLLFHGRVNNMRIIEMILYFFYKNFLFTIVHFFYAWYNLSSGQTIIDDWFISLYNMIFTAVPLGVRAFMDKDLSLDDHEIIQMLLPFLYKENRDNPTFTIRAFFFVFLRGSIQSIIMFFITLNVFNTFSFNQDGNVADLWFISVNLFTSIIIIVTLRLLVEQKFFTIFNNLGVILTTILPYTLFLIYVQNSSIFNSVGAIYISVQSNIFWLNIILICGINFLLDYLNISILINFYETLTNSLRKVISSQDEFNPIELPDNVVETLRIYQNDSKKNQMGEYQDIKNPPSKLDARSANSEIRLKNNEEIASANHNLNISHNSKLVLKDNTSNDVEENPRNLFELK